jgi:hypothetical protein
MGVLGAVALFAALPASAGAQATDTTPPTVLVATPAQGATFVKGQAVSVSFACTDDVAVADCVGTLANGAALDTSVVGPGSFTVTAHDTSGNPQTVTNTYSVVEQDPGDVGGETPATLTLTLGPAGALGPFVPGIGKDYTTTMTAKVISTAENALLTVADPSATAPGHLVNGTYVLAQALKATAASVNGTSSPLADIGSSAAPTPLETWNGPANDDVSVTFVQPIATSDLLRTGGYAKTLTFTLSTTQP